MDNVSLEEPVDMQYNSPQLVPVIPKEFVPQTLIPVGDAELEQLLNELGM